MSHKTIKRKRCFNDDNKSRSANVNKKRKYSQMDLLQSNKARKWTVSIALPGSVMNTAKTPQLQTYLASQFARILSIFCIDEIIIFSENGTILKEETFKPDPNLFLFRLLSYLETPQYLRRLLFPLHNDFRYVGICKPLRTPNHLNKNEISKYREGIVLKRCIQVNKTNHNNNNNNNKKLQKIPKIIQKMNNNNNENNNNTVSIVSIGLNKECIIDKKLIENERVTVEIMDENSEYFFGVAVKPTDPIEKDGIYWGYKTRVAKDFSQVISNSMYKNGYDFIIGTSDKGENIYDDDNTFKIKKFKHLLIVFGGPNGLESCMLNKEKNIKLDKPQLLFDEYINVCPFQGTKTIRTEEAVLITLSVLQPHLQNNYHSKSK